MHQTPTESGGPSTSSTTYQSPVRSWPPTGRAAGRVGGGGGGGACGSMCWAQEGPAEARPTAPRPSARDQRQGGAARTGIGAGRRAAAAVGPAERRAWRAAGTRVGASRRAGWLMGREVLSACHVAPAAGTVEPLVALSAEVIQGLRALARAQDGEFQLVSQARPEGRLAEVDVEVRERRRSTVREVEESGVDCTGRGRGLGARAGGSGRGGRPGGGRVPELGRGSLGWRGGLGPREGARPRAQRDGQSARQHDHRAVARWQDRGLRFRTGASGGRSGTRRARWHGWGGWRSSRRRLAARFPRGPSVPRAPGPAAGMGRQSGAHCGPGSGEAGRGANAGRGSLRRAWQPPSERPGALMWKGPRVAAGPTPEGRQTTWRSGCRARQVRAGAARWPQHAARRPGLSARRPGCGQQARCLRPARAWESSQALGRSGGALRRARRRRQMGVWARRPQRPRQAGGSCGSGSGGAGPTEGEGSESAEGRVHPAGVPSAPWPGLAASLPAAAARAAAWPAGFPKSAGLESRSRVSPARSGCCARRAAWPRCEVGPWPTGTPVPGAA